MHQLNLEYTSTTQPFSKGFLWLIDLFKIALLSATLFLVALFILFVINSYTDLRFLNNHNIISDNQAPLWVALVPELLFMSLGMIVGGVLFYLNNHMAYSGYKFGIMVVAVISAGILTGLLMFLINTFPGIKLTFRNVEAQIQSPLPSQGYMNTIKNESEAKGYIIGWIVDYDDNSVTINKGGKKQTFDIDSTQESSFGDSVIVTSRCNQELGCHYELIPIR